MITLKSCPVCDSDRIAEFRVVPGEKIVVEVLHGIKINALIVTRYCLCQDCRLIFQNPRLSDAELDIYYGSGYYRKTMVPPPEGMDQGEENRARVDAKIIKEHLGKVESHLDVGCGSGYLLDAVGARVRVGVESDVDYVKVNGVEVSPGIDQVPARKFDLVSAIHVLEHVPYPLQFLKKMTKFVKKSGHLVIDVPSQETRGGPFGFPHLSYFEPEVLKNLCAKAGLGVIHEEFTPHLVLICKLRPS